MSNLQVDEALLQLKEALYKGAELVSTYTHTPTARSVFSPENLDEKIKFLVPIDTPLRNRFPRVKGLGMHAEWKKMTSGLHAKSHPATHVGTGTGTTIAFADAAAPGETQQTYASAVAAYKLLGRKLEVGGLALAASRGRAGEPDMQKSREIAKSYEVMLGEEELIIAGDAAIVTTEFSGLNKQITTNSGNCAFVTYSGVGNWAQTIYGKGGNPTALVLSPRQLQALSDDLQKSGTVYQAAVAQGEVGKVIAGFAVSKLINPVTSSLIDLIPSRFVGYGGLLLTEKSPGGDVWIEMDELIPMSRVDVPSTTFSYVSFILEALALKVIGEPFQLEFTTKA